MLFPGGVGCFLDDRPFGDGLKFAKWLDHLIYYYDGRFGAEVASRLSPKIRRTGEGLERKAADS